MRAFFLIFTLSLLSVITGCATTDTNITKASVPESEPSIPAEEAPKAADIPPELLFNIMAAEVAWQRKEYETAAKYYKRISKEVDDPAILKRSTQVFAIIKDYNEAIRIARRWVSLSPDDVEAKQGLAMLLMAIGDTKEPVILLKEVLSQENGVQIMDIVSLLGRQPNKDVVLKVMNEVMVDYQKDTNALFAYAHLATRLGKYDVAIESLDMVLKRKKNWPEAVMMRARILQMKNEPEAALAYLAKLLKKPLSDNTDVRLLYARMLMSAGQLDAAHDQYKLLAKQHPDNPNVLYALGLIALQKEQVDEAETQLKRLINLGKRRLEASYHLGLIDEFKGNPDSAIKWFTVVTRGQFYHQAQLKIASILSNQKQYQKALDHLDEVEVTNEKEYLQTMLLRGEILYHAKRFQEAYDLHELALTEIPDNANLLYGRAMAAERLDRLDQAVEGLKKILTNDPSNVQALNGLGYILADRTDRYDEALGYLQQAFALKPKDPAIMDSMGWVLFRMGKYDDALKYIEQAYEVLNDPEVAAHLGEILWAKGEQERASAIWREAMEREPDHEILLETMKRFEQ